MVVHSGFERWLTALPAALAVGVGVYQLYFTACVRLGVTFQAMVIGLFAPAAASVLLFLWARGTRPTGDAARPRPSGPPWTSWGGVVLACVAMIGWWRGGVPFWLFWGVSIAYLATLATAVRPAIGLPRRMGWLDAVAVVGAMVAGALAVVMVNSPNGDDGFYLAEAVATVRHPELPVLSFDPMYPDFSVPVHNPAHKAAGFEVFSAVVMSLTGLGALDVYYFVLPVAFGACTGGINWLLIRAIAGARAANLASLLLVGLLVLWGGHHVAIGNLSFARMYQGKGVLVTLFVPLVIYQALAFVGAPSWRSWALLVLAQCAAAFATSTGLVIGPLAAALVVLAGLTVDRAGVLLAVGGLVSALPSAGMLLWVKLDSMPDIRGGSRLELIEVLGGGWRVPFTLGLVLLLPLLARSHRLPSASWIARYVLVFLLFVFNGLTPSSLADLGGNLFTSRVFWSVPLPLLVATSLALICTTRASPLLGGRLPGPFLVCGLLAVFASSARPTWEEDGASPGFSRWKVPESQFEAARALVRHTYPGEQILGPGPVNVRVTSLEPRARLVAVRKHYSRVFRTHLGKAEVTAQEKLICMVKDLRCRATIPWFLQQLDERCVTGLVVAPKVHQRRPEVEEALARAGFTLKRWQERRGGYHLWLRTPEFRPKCAQASERP